MDAPADYKNAGIANLAAGAIGAFYSVSILLASFCFGIWYLAFAGAHAWQAYVGWQMFNGARVPHGKTAAIVGAVCGLLGCNPIAIVGSAIAFVLMGKPEAQQYAEG
jgi:hypothetical protein